VRAWPLGFDLAGGVHFRLTGGAGRANATGVAQLTMVLPPGRVDPAGLMSMDVLVLVTGANGAVVDRRTYADRRFDRPAPVQGSAANAITGSWVVCETGVGGNAPPLPAGGVPRGGHVVLVGPPPTIVDRTTIALPPTWDPNTLLNRLAAATDIVSLTTPAFGSTPDRADLTGRPLPRTPTTGGDPLGGIDTIVGQARVHRLDRSLLAGATASSVPYALLDRFEVAGATVNVAAGTAAAAIGAAPPVPWMLEPTTTQFLGHPGGGGVDRGAWHRGLAQRRSVDRRGGIRARTDRWPRVRASPDLASPDLDRCVRGAGGADRPPGGGRSGAGPGLPRDTRDRQRRDRRERRKTAAARVGA
jgi:hypothetical protein